MAVTPPDLLAPAGPVEEQLFPGEGDGTAGTDLNARLTEYISQAEAKAAGIAFPEPDLAVESWALHLTFKAAYMVAVSRPANENTMVEVLGSKGFAKDQRDALLEKAKEYKQDYQNLAAAVPSTAQPVGLRTRTTKNEYEY